MDGSREVHGRVMRAQHRTADTDQHAANMDTMHGDHAWISHGDQEARTTRGVGRHVAEKRVKMVGIKPKPRRPARHQRREGAAVRLGRGRAVDVLLALVPRDPRQRPEGVGWLVSWLVVLWS